MKTVRIIFNVFIRLFKNHALHHIQTAYISQQIASDKLHAKYKIIQKLYFQSIHTRGASLWFFRIVVLYIFTKTRITYCFCGIFLLFFPFRLAVISMFTALFDNNVRSVFVCFALMNSWMIYAFFEIDCARRRVQYSKCFFLNTFICNEWFYFSNNRYTNQLYAKNKKKNIVFFLKNLFLMEDFDELGSSIVLKSKWNENDD